jgi:hypothetical protein
MEHNQQKKEKQDQDYCRQIVEARDAAKKCGEKKFGDKLKTRVAAREKPENGVFFSQPFLPDQFEREQEKPDTEGPYDDLNLD